MIDPEKRMSIWNLVQSGTSIAEIVRMFKIDHKTVRSIIKKEGGTSLEKGADNIKS